MHSRPVRRPHAQRPLGQIADKPNHSSQTAGLKPDNKKTSPQVPLRDLVQPLTKVNKPWNAEPGTEAEAKWKADVAAEQVYLDRLLFFRPCRVWSRPLSATTPRRFVTSLCRTMVKRTSWLC